MKVYRLLSRVIHEKRLSLVFQFGLISISRETAHPQASSVLIAAIKPHTWSEHAGRHDSNPLKGNQKEFSGLPVPDATGIKLLGELSRVPKVKRWAGSFYSAQLVRA